MTTRSVCRTGALALGLLATSSPVLCPYLSSTAFAQAQNMAGIAQTQSETIRATVKAVDLPNRKVTLQGPDGNSVVLKIGDQVTNLPQVHPGDTVIAHYYTSSAYVLSPPGTKLPSDSLTVAGARAAPGAKPGAGVGTKLVVTGLVVALDPTAHTVSVVDPQGGAVRLINVVTPEGQQNMKLIKVGDTITAIMTDAVLVAVEPAS